MREVSHTEADKHGGGRIWNLNGIEDGPDTFIGLKLLRDARDGQGASVERKGVFRGAEELFTKADHSFPVKPNDDNDDSGDNINNADVGPKEVSSNVTDGED